MSTGTNKVSFMNMVMDAPVKKAFALHLTKFRLSDLVIRIHASLLEDFLPMYIIFSCPHLWSRLIDMDRTNFVPSPPTSDFFPATAQAHPLILK